MIYMVQERAAGNGNFDIDAITRLLNADANAPVEIDQPLVDPDTEALMAEAKELETDLQNPSSNRVDEAQAFMQRTGAAKLNVSGLLAGITIQESRNEFSGGARGNDRVWEERKDREDKDRREQAKIADMADDANNGQLSTKPDQFGNSQQDYADLSNELKTRDGQERYMSFLRLLHPNMTDAQIRERMEKTAAIAAREANQPLTERQQGLLENMPSAEEAELKSEVDQYNEMNAGRFTPTVANRVDAQTVTTTANAEAETAAAGSQVDLLSGGEVRATTPTRTSLTAQVEGQGEFAATAPSLRDHHRAALAATAPLDQPAPQVIASAAPVAPVPAVNAGFDV